MWGGLASQLRRNTLTVTSELVVVTALVVASGLVVTSGLVVASGLAPRWAAKQPQ